MTTCVFAGLESKTSLAGEELDAPAAYIHHYKEFASQSYR